MKFDSPKAFAAHLAKLSVLADEAIHLAADKCGQIIEDTAKAEIGNPDMYDARMAGGPFSPWPELLPETELEKQRKGYPVDAPLLRTGELQQSISHYTEHHKTVVGSTDPKMVFHEFGTRTVPPRPVIGPAIFMNKPVIERGLGTLLFTLLSGQSWRRHLLLNWKRKHG